jgi:hypothetical protein
MPPEADETQPDPATPPAEAAKAPPKGAADLRARANAATAVAKAKRAESQAARERLRLEAEQRKADAERAGKPTPLPPNVADLDPTVLERIRQSVVSLQGAGVPISVERVRKAAQCDQQAASDVVGAIKAGLMPPVTAPWIQGAGPTGRVLPTGRARDQLLADLRGAKTPAQCSKVSLSVAAFVAQGQLDSATARTIVDACKEARAGMEAQAKRDPSTADPDDRAMALMTEAALAVGKALDTLSEDRRAMVLSFVADMADQELEEAALAQGESPKGGTSG